MKKSGKMKSVIGLIDDRFYVALFSTLEQTHWALQVMQLLAVSNTFVISMIKTNDYIESRNKLITQ